MISCKIVTPDGLYKTLETSLINIGTIDGQRGILPNHMPIVLILDISCMTTEENGVRKNYAVNGGMLYFENNEATILTNSVESQEEIDLRRAQDAKQRAEMRIAAKDPNIDLRRAEVALKKAINRIKVKQY